MYNSLLDPTGTHFHTPRKLDIQLLHSFPKAFYRHVLGCLTALQTVYQSRIWHQLSRTGCHTQPWKLISYQFLCIKLPITFLASLTFLASHLKSPVQTKSRKNSYRINHELMLTLPYSRTPTNFSVQVGGFISQLHDLYQELKKKKNLLGGVCCRAYEGNVPRLGRVCDQSILEGRSAIEFRYLVASSERCGRIWGDA